MAKLFFFDLETTGLSPAKNGIHQISGEIVIDGETEKQFSWCIKSDEPVRWFRLQDELADIYRRIMKYYR